MPNVLLKSKPEHRKRKPLDVVMEHAFDTDIIIPIVGQTGVGKSTFINIAIGLSATAVGHDLSSCTTKIQPVTCRHPADPSRRIVFVDTPGFDNTSGDDFAGDWNILRRIATWLARSYGVGMKLTGVIYLHEVSQARVPKMPTETVGVLNRLCGSTTPKNVVLATTKWCDISYGDGKQRERQLGATLWNGMCDRGSQLVQFQGTRESAWAIVDLIIRKDCTETTARPEHPLPTQARTELLELAKLIPETEEGKSLRAALDVWAETRDRAVAQSWPGEGNGKVETGDELHRRLQDAATQLRSRIGQIQELKISSAPRIFSFFGIR
ncbi:hypothetical protein BV22DRAFT_1089086 [Leucogyrophana mollusca]|uniref:Uncharacterized protein n=1 Tax=Leucogyrophana mollusca TaxID=85980 RepID=A0ACB8BKL7_9AGAM|nr:hypothetical protein BV22DRAFT_1089086 [Leucogyrophana mollusca]